MGILGNIIGSASERIKDSSDSKYIEELKPKMINSAIANDFESWFKSQLKEKPFLYSQYNFYDSCERFVIVDNDCVAVCFEIEKENIGDAVTCNYANTLGYKPLTANGLTYSNGKMASERVLVKTFAEVTREIIMKVFNEECIGDFKFRHVTYDDGTDKSGSYMDQVIQRANASAFGGSARLNQSAEFTYTVPKQEQKSAF